MTGGPRKGDRSRLQLGIAAVAALGMLIFCALRLRVNNDITHFLPAGTDHRLADLSRQLADSSLTRTMILDVGGADPQAVKTAAAALAARLAPHPEVAWLERGPTPALAESVYKLYAQRLPYFVSDQPDTEVPALLSDAGLDRAARALKQQMSSPMASMFSRLAPSDPLGWFPAILRRFERARAGSLEVDGDQFVTPDHRHAIIFVGSRHSALDGSAQRPLLAEIRRAFDDVNRQAGGALALQQAGVAPIAVDAERRMSGDLTRISALSTVAVLLVLILHVRVAPQHPHRLPARRRRRPRVDHGGAAAVRAGARPDAGDRIDADRRRDRLPDPACSPIACWRPTSRPTRRSTASGWAR